MPYRRARSVTSSRSSPLSPWSRIWSRRNPIRRVAQRRGTKVCSVARAGNEASQVKLRGAPFTVP